MRCVYFEHWLFDLPTLLKNDFNARVNDQQSVTCPFKVRICEHVGISYLTGKTIEANNGEIIAIQKHLLCCNYSPSFEDFSILTVK